VMWLSAERVAEAGYEAVMKNRAISIPGAQYKLIAALVRLLPLSAGHRLGELRSRILARGKRP
jgi:short-subunit dehydrogenase